MQAAPDLASASVALNTSVLYIDRQSARESVAYYSRMITSHTIGFVGVAFVAFACLLLAAIWEPPGRRRPA